MYRVAMCCLLLLACGDNLPGTLGDDEMPTGPQCNDGVDNDGDGTADFPEDLGCESILDDSEDSPTLPACSDNRDNDGDGRMDYPEDPGCFGPEQDSEVDDCPVGPNCPACSNMLDDDGNGAMDYPNDPGCESAGDPIEFTENPVACGEGLTISQLPVTGVVTGTLDTTSVSNLITSCGGGAGSPAHAYVLILNEPKIVVASTVDPITTIDTVIDIRRSNCSEASAHVACNDDERPSVQASRLTVSLDPGVYYIIVEGHDPSVSGPYQLTVQQFSGEGATCTMQGDCGPGLVCRIPLGEVQMVCAKPVCSDGADDDGDGIADFPNDPGCTDPNDADELDDCPNGVNCPACSNGVDDDLDNQTDFPMDTGCSAASSTIEGCGTEQDPILQITSGTTTGTLVGAHDDHDPTCTGGGDLDIQYTLAVPTMRSLSLATAGSAINDTVLSLRPSTCGPDPIACDDDGGASLDSLIEVTDLPGATYVVAVEGFDEDDIGEFTLTVSGVIAAGQSCETPLFAAGAFTCEAPSTCQGSPGARTCQTQCSDGMDNNGDGTTDFPNDPGCDSPLDNDENTVCPGAMCPQCADTTDNDGDGDIDFPDDPNCASAADNSEGCPSTEAVMPITQPVINGTTTGATDDVAATCGSSSGTGPDLTFQLDLPALERLSVVVEPEAGFDAVVVIQDAACGPGELVCRDASTGNETAELTNLAAGQYFVVLDGFNSGDFGTFTLRTQGVIAPGGSCESPLFAAGVLTCGQGLPCTGAVGSRTCSSACSDGVDNDGDGAIDFPEEPGCASVADDDEADSCPGAGCPQCADTVDNDGDGDVDFPNDPDCTSAADNLEASQCFATEAVVPVVSPTTSGTTVGANDDIDLTCGSSSGTGRDVALQLDLPAMRDITLDLTSVSFDSVHGLLVESCSQPELVCRDPSTLSYGHLPAGTYFLVVDGFGTTSQGTFTLTTSGHIEPGGSCEGQLFASGALTCADNLTCQGPPGARTCFSECSDGVDNNGDGKIDFPEDPGCASRGDTDENDVTCPGAGCPVCANSSDDDGDMLQDFPVDFGCVGAGTNTEVFCAVEADVAGVITQFTTPGNLAAPSADNYEQSCQSSTGFDVSYALQLPVPVVSLRLDTEGSTISDTVISLKDANCGIELGCDDDGGTSLLSALQVLDVPAGNYAINVDAFSTNSGAFTLHVRGTVAAGTACTSPLFANGVLVCPTGTSCTGGVCQ